LFRCDLPELRAVLAHRYQTWSVGSALPCPLNDQYPEMHRGSQAGVDSRTRSGSVGR
jgi:hypothetical protein